MNKAAKLLELTGGMTDPRLTVSPTRSNGVIGGGSASAFDRLQHQQDQERKRKKKNKKDKGVSPLGFRPDAR